MLEQRDILCQKYDSPRIDSFTTESITAHALFRDFERATDESKSNWFSATKILLIHTSVIRFDSRFTLCFFLTAWRWSFLFSGGRACSFGRDQREFRGREYLYTGLFLSWGGVQWSERPPIGIPQVGALANSNLSADTSAKCGMSWQSCRMSVSRVLHPDASSAKVLGNFPARKHFVTPLHKGSHTRAWHM